MFVQFEKLDASIEVVSAGIVTSVRPVQLAKAPSSRVVTLSGIVNAFNALQLLNA